MNEKTCKLMEFDAIRERVASRAMSEEAGKIILGEEPLLGGEETSKLKSLVASLLNRIIFLEGENRESLPSIGEFLPKLDLEGAVLEAVEMYALGIFVERASALKQWLLKPYHCGAEGRQSAGIFQDDEITVIARELPACEGISSEIFKVIDHEGNFRDLPVFKEIRRRILSLQKDLESAGSRYAKSEETRRMLQSEIPSQRDGRMVLAVKANFRSRIRGIVHEVSSSGQTVFVEPEEVVEKNNELLIENRRLEAEMRRVLRELTAAIAAQREVLGIFHKGILFLETIRARARYSHESKGCFAIDSWQDKYTSSPEGAFVDSHPRPVLEENKNTGETGGLPELVLKKARHPLLGNRAVPLDLCMAKGIGVVIITGPNTGGKTVALKTLGLLALMNQFGLALPAEEGTMLPVFDGVYADIGDEQSLSQSLSTFSAHMTNIAEIISRATNKSLVLLDELGSGTDPEEGSAIAMAILDHFIETETTLIITTHHGILKNYGYTRKGVENASMEFDSRTLSPTFKIVMGIPGESRAVDIASRNGFPPELLSRARSYLDEERSDVSALIAGLKEKHRELDDAARERQSEKKKLLEERRKADLKELRLRQKELLLRSDGAGSLKRLLSESRKTLENLVREVKEGELSREKTLKVKEFLAGLEAQVREEDSKLEQETEALAGERRRLEEDDFLEKSGFIPGKSTALESGMEVLAGEYRRRGRIIRKDKKVAAGNQVSWIVEIGSLKMSFPESALFPLPAANGGSSLQRKPSWAADLVPSAPVQMELKLLGMRLNEALQALSRQIDAAVLSGLHEFSVVHGKGDGILSVGIHGFLKDDPRVADYFFSRPEAGGFGRTEVVLK